MKQHKYRFILLLLVFIITTVPAFAGTYETTIDAFSYGNYEIPAYDGDPSEVVNGNLPTFSAEELYADPYVYYGDLDELGRCTPASSLLNVSLMPTGSRGSISSVYPSGWEQAKYDIVPGNWLYNRCHLIGWQLTGADLNSLPKAELAKNLITGTRFLNVGTGDSGMVGYENEVAHYLREDDENEVAYRVTPVFGENNLVAYGVLMEGQSVASNDVEFCAFCYNVQPEIAIDYETGKSMLAAGLDGNTEISSCQIIVGEKAVYNGSECRVKITVMDGDKVLAEGVDYETVWQANTFPGKATVTIAGVGSYRGAVMYRFNIVPARAKLVKVQAYGSKTIRAETRKQERVSGFQYAWRIKGKAWKKSATNRNVRIIRSLKKGKIYQVKARAFKKIDGKNWYGKWSKVKKVRVR